MKINKSQAALGLAALVVISTVGMASVTLASGKTTSVANKTVGSTTEHFGRGNGRGMEMKNLTEAEKTAKQAEMTAKRTAEETALKANDYNLWVTAVGVNSPILQKINATNFSRYVELYNLRQQEKTIATELGLNNGEGHGMGMGRGEGLGLGLGQK
jgi:hypothetical protein